MPEMSSTELDKLAQLAEQISQSHCLPDQIHNANIAIGTPGKREMGELVGLLRDIIFPGFQPSKQLDEGCVVEHVHQRTVELRNMLGVMIDWAIRQYACAAAATSVDAAELNSDELISQFIGSLPEISTQLKCDVTAAFEGDPACTSLHEIVLCYPGFLATTVFRFANRLHKIGVPLLPRMMSEWVHGETGIDIHPAATIGRAFFIDHGTGVVIGATCVIGDEVKIYQGVTLGALSFPRDADGRIVRDTKRHPTIGDRVVIYANATVLGGDTNVGHDSVIGSSVWLTSSVDPYTTVVMEKPKLRMRNAAPSEFEAPLDFQI